MMRKDLYIFSEPARDRMYRYARTLLGDRDEALDTVQDVIGRLWRMGKALEEVRDPEAFAIRSVRNSCIDRLRCRRNMDREVFPEIVQRAEAEKWTDVQMVRTAMGRLPEKQRTVIHLKDIEGFGTDEIAGILGIRENQTRMILSRARKALREIIIRENDRCISGSGKASDNDMKR